MTGTDLIRTPDQRLRIFISSTLVELAPERAAAGQAVRALQLVPVMFEQGARPYPPRSLYRAYVAQSQVFVGIYWQSYGWVAPGEDVSGLEDEYHCAAHLPRLIYIKEPSPEREEALTTFLAELKRDDRTSYKRFAGPDELRALLQRDLAVLLSERFEAASRLADGGDARARASVPAPLTALVGREQDIRSIGELVLGGVRLLTITGPGGVGKSRIAAAVASELQHELADGAQVVWLASIDDPALMMPAIAAQLGVRLDGGQRATDALAHHLAGRQTLLVLDNLEQIAAAAPEVVALAERLPDLHLVVTSRTPLRVAGEQLWPLDPLGVPDLDAASAAAIEDAAAIELFVQRARAADPTFRLDDRNAADVAALCRRLDGLPLAIELAAARVRLLPPSQILARLGPRLELLAGGPERPARHRTMAATIDWSVQLLAAEDQALFARLSVFAGGATLDAIEAVCDVEASGEVMRSVEALLDQGLVRVADTGFGAPRLDMLETVRAEASSRLVERGEEPLLRRRHLDWFAELSDRAQPFLCGPDQVRWLGRMDPERANLRAAAETAFGSGDAGTVLEMAWDLYVYYQLRGAYDEPAAWMRRLEGMRERLDDRQRSVRTTALAIAALSTGEADLAVEAAQLQDALSTFEREGATFEMAVAHMHLGLCALATSDWPRAADAERSASQRFAHVGHDWGVGSSENLLGVALGATGDATAAKAAHERALAAAHRIANETIASQALTMLAALALDGGDLGRATQLIGEAAPLIETARDAIGASGCLEVTAAALLHRGDAPAARLALDVAAATRRRVGSPLNVVLRGRVDRLREAVDTRLPGDADDDLAAPAPHRDDVFAVLRRLVGTLDQHAVPETGPSLAGT